MMKKKAIHNAIFRILDAALTSLRKSTQITSKVIFKGVNNRTRVQLAEYEKMIMKLFLCQYNKFRKRLPDLPFSAPSSHFQHLRVFLTTMYVVYLPLHSTWVSFTMAGKTASFLSACSG